MASRGWQIGDSVRIEIHGLDYTVLPSRFSQTDFEKLLESLGVVTDSTREGYFTVDFHKRKPHAGLLLSLQVNAAGLRESWCHGQAVIANKHFFTQRSMMANFNQEGIDVEKLPPNGEFLVVGKVVQHIKNSMYSVELDLPCQDGTTSCFEFDFVKADHLYPLWSVGDSVYILSFATAAVLQCISENHDIDFTVLRSCVGTIMDCFDHYHQRYLVHFYYPGRNAPIPVRIKGHRLRSAMPSTSFRPLT